MAEIFPIKGAKDRWVDAGNEVNDEWIRLYIFIKGNESYQDQRKKIILIIKRIIERLEKARKLKSFHFLYEPFPDEELPKLFPDKVPEGLIGFTEFKYDHKYHINMLDVRIWIKKSWLFRKASISADIAKRYIRSEFKKEDVKKIADFGFWHFPKQQKPYDLSSGSELYYSLICKIYELFCRFQFEMMDPDNSERIGKDFNESKIIHCFLNSLGKD